MIHWINSHGVECIVFYLIYAGIIGSMPPLPKNAGFWAQWGYGALQALAMNLRQALQLMNITIPKENK